MIQRIQSLYFFIAFALMVAMMFFPFVTIAPMDSPETTAEISFRGFTSDGSWNWTGTTWQVPVMAIVIALLSVGNIFLFTNRTLQVKVCIFNVILMVGWYILLALEVWIVSGEMACYRHFGIVTVFPLICIVLTWLGMRGVLRDDALVKSMDRIR